MSTAQDKIANVEFAIAMSKVAVVGFLLLSLTKRVNQRLPESIKTVYAVDSLLRFAWDNLAITFGFSPHRYRRLWLSAEACERWAGLEGGMVRRIVCEPEFR